MPHAHYQELSRLHTAVLQLCLSLLPENDNYNRLKTSILPVFSYIFFNCRLKIEFASPLIQNCALVKGNICVSRIWTKVVVAREKYGILT